MTKTSDSIKKLISYSWNDWVVTSNEQRQVLDLIRADPNLDSTIFALHTDGFIDELIHRIYDSYLKNELIQVLGGKLSHSTAGMLMKDVASIYIPNPVVRYFSWVELFSVCNHLLNTLKVHGVRFGTGSSPIPGTIGTADDAPFSGVGATGVNASKHDIPYIDQIRLATKHNSTTRLYSNPLGSLSSYLSGLTAQERLNQARSLIRQPISSIFEHAYTSRLPNREQVIRFASRLHNLHPALVAGFILAEQRDQSRNEDAAEYLAATSVKLANTSIGLGQIVVSTAKNNSLFSDFLPPTITNSLNHKQIATLLASDEFNILAVAKYIRQVANSAVSISSVNANRTKAAYPAVNFAMYSLNSSTWPDDNIKVMGSEYTSKAWDGKIFSNWGNFVFEAYIHVKNAGIF